MDTMRKRSTIVVMLISAAILFYVLLVVSKQKTSEPVKLDVVKSEPSTSVPVRPAKKKAALNIQGLYVGMSMDEVRASKTKRDHRETEERLFDLCESYFAPTSPTPS